MKLHKKHSKRIVGFSMFCKLRPRQVKLQRAMPLNQCGCDSCINFKLIRSSLQSNECVNVSMRATVAVCNSLCPVKVENESEKYDLLKYNRDCIFSKCKTCGNANKSIQDVTPAVVNCEGLYIGTDGKTKGKQ